MRARLIKAVIAATILAMVTSLGGITRAEASEGQEVKNLADGITAEELVAILIGDGTQYSNIKVHGDPKSIGTFSGFTKLGAEAGVVLSTGYVSANPDVNTYPKPNLVLSAVPGPNNLTTSTTDDMSSSVETDDDLSPVLENSGLDPNLFGLFNIASLEFDFVAKTHTLQFSYIFGSEEYVSFVGSRYNDIFGLFVNGVNCATVNDGDNITVNNINPGSNAEYYRDNQPDADDPIDTGFNGVTTVLTCETEVNAGKTNHVRFAIADVGDMAFDSGVFIVAGSFVTDPPTAIKDDEDATVIANGTGDDNNVTIDVLANDQEGAELNSITPPTNGTAKIDDTKVVYTPKVGFSGKDKFTYTATAPKSNPSEATVTVTVIPVAKPDSKTSGQTGITIDVLENDIGIGLNLNTVTQPANGTVTKSGNQVVYTPKAGFSGTDKFTYTVIDTIDDKPGNASAAAEVTVTVQAGPVAGPDSATTSAGDPVTIDVLANDSSKAILGDVSAAPANGSVAKSGTKFVYTPKAGFSGTDEFKYTITDSLGSPATGTVTVTVVPLPVAKPDTANAKQGEATKIDVASNDTGRGITLTSAAAGEHGATAIADGKVNYTPTAGYSGRDSFTYVITDDLGKPATGTVAVTIPPTAKDDATTVGQVAKSINVLSNDSGKDLKLDSVAQPSHGSTAISGNQVVYTPTPGYVGTDSFTYVLSDGVSTATATVTVTVVDGPTAKDVSVTIGQGKTASITVPIDGNALTAAAGEHGTTSVAGGVITYTPAADYNGTDSFTYVITDALGSPATGTVNVTIVPPPTATADAATTGQGKTVTVNVLGNDTGSSITLTSAAPGKRGATAIVDGKITYTPAADYAGADTFTYVITDTYGNTASGTVTVTIVAAPTATADAATIGQGQVAVVNVLGNDTGSSITLTSAAPGAHGATAIVDGKITYTPVAGYAGTDTFTYVITDNQRNTATGTVTVTIVAAPTASADAATIGQGKAVTVNVLGNDTGSSITLTSAAPGAHGTTAIVDGKITYTPAVGYAGTDTFTYVITDNQRNTATGTVTVTIMAAPVANNDVRVTTQSQQPILFDPLDNDSWSGETITLGIGQPTLGSAVLGGGSGVPDSVVAYTPSKVGTDTFTYTITDAWGNTATGTISVAVHPALDAEDDSVETDQDLAVTIDVLANDTGWNVALASVGKPAHGTAVIDKGKVVYTPAAGYSGTDTFTYLTTDELFKTATATVTVKIIAKVVVETGGTVLVAAPAARAIHR